MMATVPVIQIGGWLKAVMKPMPSTVPGMT